MERHKTRGVDEERELEALSATLPMGLFLLVRVNGRRIASGIDSFHHVSLSLHLPSKSPTACVPL